MDENSCEDETSKSVENVVDGQTPKEVENLFKLEDMKIKAKQEDTKINENEVSDRCGSSYDASVSGTSTDVSTLAAETTETTETIETTEPIETTETPKTENEVQQQVPTSANVSNAESTQDQKPNVNRAQLKPNSPLLPIYEETQSPSLQVPAFVGEQLTTRKTSLGPPPSYSFVMKQKKKVRVPSPIDPVMSNRPPPPAYSGNRGLFSLAEEGRLERMCNLPSFGEPIWRSHSQPAFCHRCGVIVLSTTHSHDSIATHLAALALCLFGCWPCCLLPYCLNVCKNTYHHCPVCQAFLGVYSPW